METRDIATATVEERATTVNRVSIRSGLMVLGGLLLYFFIMAAVDLLRVVELRAFNFAILISGIIYSINKVKNNRGRNFDYFEGLAAGFLTTLYAVIPFATFVFVYLWKINPGFMQYIRENLIYGNNLTPILAAHAILIEGIVSGAVASFVTMQYFKRYAKGPK